MTAPRRHSKLGHLNIHIDEAKDRFTCDIRVKRSEGLIRRVRHFDSLSAAVEWRDEARDELGLPTAEDNA